MSDNTYEKSKRMKEAIDDLAGISDTEVEQLDYDVRWLVAIMRFLTLYEKAQETIGPNELRACGTAVAEILQVMGSLNVGYIQPWKKMEMFSDIWSLHYELDGIMEELGEENGFVRLLKLPR